MRTWLSVAMLLAACTGRKPGPSSDVEGAAAAPAPAPEPLQFVVEDTPTVNMDIVLSEGTPPGGRVPRTPPADARSLSDAAVARLLSRLPPVDAQVGDQVDFAKRADSLPPPQAGDVIDLPFPPPPSDLDAPEVSAEPLVVRRWSPDGAVPLAPNLSVTFSQPMVAVGTVAGASETLPVRLSPEPPGQWRWIGTQTLLFEPEGGQLPKATDYTVSVPAGTASAVDTALGDDFQKTFSTPPLRLLEQLPQGSAVPLEPLILLGFDQRIDPDALAGKLIVRAGQQEIAWRYASDAEIAEDDGMARRVEGLIDGRFVVLRPEAPLPHDTSVQVSVEAGAPSAEGPRTTPNAQHFGFRTYGPLKITDTECGYRDRCKPYDNFQLTLSNPLDMARFETDLVTISPELPGAQIWSSGSYLHIGGQKEELTTYTVTLSESLTDIFGQQLTGDRDKTFKVSRGDRPDPYLWPFQSKVVVLDPSAEATLPLQTVAMSSADLRVYRVSPEDWPQWVQWQRYLEGYTDARATPPGEMIHRERISIAQDGVEQTVTELPLAAHLGGEPGHLVIWVQPTRQPSRRWDQQHAVAWVQLTQLGVTALVDQTEMLAWATDLKTGAPVSEATVSLLSDRTPPTQTDPQGLATLALPEAGDEFDALIVQRGDDLALLPESGGYWSGGSWRKAVPGPQAAWFVFDDRQMYRPGETASVKGWVRALHYAEGGDVSALDLSDRRVSWRLMDAYGNEAASGAVDLTTLGGFHLQTELPDTMNLGDANLMLELPGTGWRHYHRLQVQEFRRPEFEATVSSEAGPHFLGEEKTATALGRYYAGGALPGAPVSWTVSASAGSFTPPNHDEYQFGAWNPWWRGAWYHGDMGPVVPAAYQTFQGTADGAGEHHLDMLFRAVAEPIPMQVTVSAAITDVNRQTWSSSDTLLVHPASAYVGIRSEKPYYDKGEAVSLDLVAVSVDGERVAGRPIAVEVERKQWAVQKNGQWTQEVVESHACALTSAEDAVACRFSPEAGGAFSVTAQVTDAEGRLAESHYTVWVSGAEPEAKRTVGTEAVTLVPDKDRYAPGDTARILVQSPIAPAELLVTWQRQGMVHAERETLTEASTVIEVPIQEGHVPNLHVQVDVVGAGKRADAVGDRADLPARPAQGRGTLDLPVSTMTRTLSVEVLPSEETMMPGAEAPLRVRVTDSSGAPVSGAEVALVAVDESVLALTGYTIGDPIGVFYPNRAAGVTTLASRDALWLADPASIPSGSGSVEQQLEGLGYLDGDFGATGAGVGGGGIAPPAPMMALEEAEVSNAPASVARSRGNRNEKAKDAFDQNIVLGAVSATTGANKPDTDAPQIAVRSNFDPLALFAPAAQTDASGEATLTLALPDNLTRYRLTAVAVSGETRFGRGESVVTAQLPLMVRPSPPRFLNFGDRFELPLVVQNQTDAPIDVEVAVRATNARFVSGDADATTAGRSVTIAGGDRAEIRFPAATDRAGTARFQFAVSAGSFADAAEVSLPVWTPATSEAFATYGQLDADGGTVAIRQPVAVPDDVWPQFGGLEVTTSTTAVGALTDAVIYLVDYPYGCAEQIGSRVLAVAALRDVLDAFDAEGLPDRAALEANVAADIEELGKRQNGDGGFGFWRRGNRSWPYVSLHVAHALVRARDKGFEVPDWMLDSALRYAKNIRRHVPAEYGAGARRSLEAYALYIRLLGGDADAAAARRVYGEVAIDQHPLEVLGWLLPVLHEGGRTDDVATILRFLDNRVSETAAAAHFVTDYGEDGYLVLHSARRTDGVLLDALIRTRPDDDLIPKLVEGLLGSRVRGRWASTQDNAFILLAMDNYFNTFEKVEPDLVARVWLGDRFVGEQVFEGRTTDKASIEAPMGWLQEVGGGDVTVANDGAGRLYYRVGMRYAPRDLNLDAREAGFTVERRYEAVDDPADVTQDDDGTWRIKAGARVRVTLTMVAPGRRTHVALVDPLPAGLEVINPDLKVSEEVPPADVDEDEMRQRGWWWWRPWYEHENLRDERVEAFSTLVYGGVYTYRYVARATTPGTFVVPPAKAEEMYHPETFGRTATAHVIVTEP